MSNESWEKQYIGMNYPLLGDMIAKIARKWILTWKHLLRKMSMLHHSTFCRCNKQYVRWWRIFLWWGSWKSERGMLAVRVVPMLKICCSHWYWMLVSLWTQMVKNPGTASHDSLFVPTEPTIYFLCLSQFCVIRTFREIQCRQQQKEITWNMFVYCWVISNEWYIPKLNISIFQLQCAVMYLVRQVGARGWRKLISKYFRHFLTDSYPLVIC